MAPTTAVAWASDISPTATCAAVPGKSANAWAVATIRRATPAPTRPEDVNHAAVDAVPNTSASSRASTSANNRNRTPANTPSACTTAATAFTKS